MNKRLATALILACTGLFLQSASAAQPVSIGNYGGDGDLVFHGVICDDNSEGSVTEQSAPRQICAQPAYGAESCRASWSVKAAAKFVCQAASGDTGARSESSAVTDVARDASRRAAQPAPSQGSIRVKRNSAGRPVPIR